MIMKYEIKILGINPLWISALLVCVFLVVCGTGGSNINWGILGSEIIFPFYTAVAVGEWCKTRTDPMFEAICAQGKSLLGWIVRRFALLFGTVCTFAAAGMAGVTIVRGENSIPDQLFTFLPVAFLLSSISVFLSLLADGPHIPAMAVGVLWLFSLMCMSLLRFPPVQYFYLFARFAGIVRPLWIVNKMILLSISMLLWFGIAFLCKKRTWG